MIGGWNTGGAGNGEGKGATLLQPQEGGWLPGLVGTSRGGGLAGVRQEGKRARQRCVWKLGWDLVTLAK